MRQRKMAFAAGALAAGLMMTGCGAEKAVFSEAPQVELAALKDEPVTVDITGADLEVLSLENPIDFCYSGPSEEMLFEMEDGVWMDVTNHDIPIDQGRFQSMASQFLNLKALEQIEAPEDLSVYGLDGAPYSVYITDSEKGEKYIYIGNQDPDGNYYVTVGETGEVYTIKKETFEALTFDFDSLVVRDSLDISVAPGDIASATVIVDGKPVSYKSTDTEALTRIAAGMSALKPREFASFYGTDQELVSAGLSEEERMTLDVEFSHNGETRSLTVYVGNFVDVMGEKRYLQLEGSRMIAVVEAAAIGDLLNLTEEQNSIQNTK